MSTTVNSGDDLSTAVAGPRPGAEPAERVSPVAKQAPTLSKDAAVSPGTHMKPTLSKEETARLGDEIYERVVRPQVEEAHHGDYVAIDVDSGGWAVADDLRVAAASMRAEHPNAVNVWLVCVGHQAVQHFGGRPYSRAS